MKKYLKIFIIIAILSLPAMSHAAGLVPCSENCGWNDLMALIGKVIDFLIFYLSLPIAAIVFAYAGFQLIVNADNPGKRAAALGVFKQVALGLVIAMAAWLIVSTILTTLIDDPSKLKIYSLLKGI